MDGSADETEGRVSMDEGRKGGGFWRRFGTLFGAGLVGVVALVPMIAPTVRAQLEAAPEPPPLPVGAVLALTMINPIILLAISVAVGIRLAPRVGLTSLLDDRAAAGTPVLPRLRPHLPAVVPMGLIGGAAVIALDLLLQPWVLGSLPDTELPAAAGGLAALAGGMLYGGITEELLIRWGLMAFLAWAGWRFLARGRGRPGPSIMWGAIVGAAIAFGIGHLPAAAATLSLTMPLVVRTVSLNAIGGILFGWIFWRRNLEAAMVAHACFHVAFFLVNLAIA